MTDPTPTADPTTTAPVTAPAPAPAPGPRRLTRAADDRMIGGVCGGLARYADVDATLVRVLTVVLLVLGVFPVVLAYALLWVVVPRA